ncbi:hypothetical protein PINS_up018910 [Pythium insidiosum]|nr:hypothetical protein PINS_up018909 [Pythium insidiosum]GLE08014.1 hypothetical protein PINS_up018910 [Pythium insidiosum]
MNGNTDYDISTARCRYPSKRCDNLRAVKRDGELHRFCEYHRVKANMNQQRLEQRRKITKHLGLQGLRMTPAQLLHAEARLLCTTAMPSHIIDPTLPSSDLEITGIQLSPSDNLTDLADLTDADIQLLYEMLDADSNFDADADTAGLSATDVIDLLSSSTSMDLDLDLDGLMDPSAAAW